MKVYHGSLEVVEHPLILKPNRKLVDQYLFHTEKALTALHFVEAIKVE